MPISAAEAEKELASKLYSKQEQEALNIDLEKRFGVSMRLSGKGQLEAFLKILETIVAASPSEQEDHIDFFGGPFAKGLKFFISKTMVDGKLRELPPDAEFDNRALQLIDYWEARCRFRADAEWHAAWCGYFSSDHGSYDYRDLLYFEILAGTENIYEILCSSLAGEHPVGTVSDTAIVLVMFVERPEGYEVVSRLLLKAGRDEGLRFTILHSGLRGTKIFVIRTLRLIVEHNLLRFTSTMEELLYAFPGLTTFVSSKSVDGALIRLGEFLSDVELEPALSADEVYLRLVADQWNPVSTLVERATRCYESPNDDVRAAVGFVVKNKRHVELEPLIYRMFEDSDLRVRQAAVWFPSLFKFASPRRHAFEDHVFRVAQSWPTTPPEGIFSAAEVWKISLHSTTQETVLRYQPYLSVMGPDNRETFAHWMGKIEPSQLRTDLVLILLADASSQVRKTALSVARGMEITTAEAPALEEMLKRKAADLRIGVLELLRRLPDAEIRASCRRLLASKNANQREAGGELEAILEAATGPATDPRDTPATGFGLSYPENRTYGVLEPKPAPVAIFTPGAIHLIQRLDAYIASRSHEEFETRDAEEPLRPLAKCVGYWFTQIVEKQLEAGVEDPLLSQIERFLREETGLSGLSVEDYQRAEFISRSAIDRPYQRGHLVAELHSHFSDLPLYLSVIREILGHLPQCAHHPPILFMDAVWDRVRKSVDAESPKPEDERKATWRMDQEFLGLKSHLDFALTRAESHLSADQWSRVWNQLRFLDEPPGFLNQPDPDDAHPGTAAMYQFAESLMTFSSSRDIEMLGGRRGIPAELLEPLYDREVIDEADFIDQAIQLNRLQWMADRTKSDRVKQTLAKLGRRIAEVEVGRGELPSPATPFVGAVRAGIGLDLVCRILATGHEIGRASYGSHHVGESRQETFGHLIGVSRPGPEDSHEKCVEALRGLKLKPERLLQLAMLSPHWAPAVNGVLGWDGFEDAIWWLHAHTQVAAWGDMKDRRNDWEGYLSERTPLTPEMLAQGYCDASWFQRFETKVTPAQWKMLHKGAKFASTGTGHVRAQLFARALHGELKPKDLIAEMHAKRNPNTVRALGLCPLGAHPDQEVRERYAALQDFLVASRQFGGMKRDTEKLAVEVALENLARTAGYADPLRMVWSLEASSVADLQGEGKKVVEGDLAVRLFFDGLGQPEMEATRGDKVLKEIPAPAKKLPAIAELILRRTQLKKQLVRMRASLEQAMQRSDSFTSEELAGLLEHPGLCPLLNNLVFIRADGKLGFPEEILGGGEVRVAHPADLLASGEWPSWQRRIVREERVQPFKQVFREYYMLTPAEQEQAVLTRFGGHVVRARQAVGILGKRGWVLRPEDGMSKTFHRLGLVARIDIDDIGYAPIEIEGVPLRTLHFTRSGQWEPLPLREISPILFSETVRDLDLVVSVASSTGFDPDVSESTVEMRANLVRETAALLGLENVELEPRHARIRGKLAEYRVHLGSGLVHQTARGELVIVAVRQPQRGRLFLPFVDDDPRTAEVVSKVLLLARDEEIKDPTILSQIVAG